AEQNVHLLHTHAALVLEGLEMHRVATVAGEKAWRHLVESGVGAPVRLANCRFVLKPNVHVVNAVDSPVLDVRNCEFLVGTGEKYVGEATEAGAWRAAGGGGCRMQTCLIPGKFGLSLDSESFPPKSAAVVLAGNTVVVKDAPVALVLDPTREPPKGGAAAGCS